MTAVKTGNAKTEIEETREISKVSKKQKESVYTLEEFVANAEEIFHTNPECVFAALKQAGITECTKQKAEEMVKAFRGRKVQ